ncbi:normocyte binding protein 2b [Pseudofrancisella aestuarii]|uniref:Normocyte binding protein 2b n=1 Tax=Pseudofrancisella aestuarii TaxID=2670347 RepID=A0ABV9TBI8_9GAMM|nr:normocyte binding protein 2b [Pseudofrancisella aestuarii]
MSRKYCVLKDDNITKTLVDLINKSYKTENVNSIQEVNLGHVLNHIDNDDAKAVIKSLWCDLEILVGHPVMLLDNSSQKGIIGKLYKKTGDRNLILNLRTDDSEAIFQSIYNASGIRVEIKDLSI